MLIHRAISILAAALFMLIAYWHIAVGDYWLTAVLYVLGALLCAARVVNYSWKYTSLSVHILFVLTSFFYVTSFWEWLTAGASLEVLRNSEAQLDYLSGTKTFFRLTIGAIIMFYQYKIARD